MPRGVYKRGPGRVKSEPPKAAPAVAHQPVVVASAIAQAEPQHSRAPEGIRKYTSRDVDVLTGDDLRAYARSAGVSPRDCAGLSEDRLRQNIKLVIQQTYELLTE